MKPMVISKGNGKVRLSLCFKIRHFLNLLCIVLDIKLCLGISPLPWKPHQRIKEYMSAPSDCCGVGKGAAVMQSDRESQAGSL